jgi:hypothetical protein
MGINSKKKLSIFRFSICLEKQRRSIVEHVHNYTCMRKSVTEFCKILNINFGLVLKLTVYEYIQYYQATALENFLKIHKMEIVWTKLDFDGYSIEIVWI